jgi:Tfp pilus assembly protein PilZ
MRVQLFILSLLVGQQLMAQLTIQPGASLHLTSNAQLTLQDMSFVNNGQFFPDSSTVLFNGGTTNRSISGIGNLSFHELRIDKPGDDLVLQAPISVSYRIYFENGNLFIGNHDVNLGRTGFLQSEFENERLYTTGTGRVIAVRTLNGAVNQMPGNLGVSITTTENLGDVTVRRGHLPQSGNGLITSIRRYYDIEPQFAPTNANATLRLAYFDAELNGLDENILQVHRSPDGSNWNNLGFTLRHTTQDYVELSGIPSFRRFTLAGPTGPLPVHFVQLSGRCENGKATLQWQTAQEENSLHFEVQRGSGSSWTTIGTLPSAGNSTTLRSYQYTDLNPQTENLYRITEKGIDGRMQYSSVLRLSCSGENKFRVYPNPATTQVTVQMQSNAAQKIRLQIHDAKGALVKEQWAAVQIGTNIVPMNISALPVGTYTINAFTAEGQRLMATTFIKR